MYHKTVMICHSFLSFFPSFIRDEISRQNISDGAKNILKDTIRSRSYAA